MPENKPQFLSIDSTGKLLKKNNKIASCCPCQIDLPNGECQLKFYYYNTNKYQDDSWDIYLKKSNGTSVKAGNIDGKCDSYQNNPPDCFCNQSFPPDYREFYFTIDQSFISGKADCSVEFYSVMTQNNGCGTFGSFDIEGPYGSGYGGFLGGNGLIDVRVACFPA